jgi:hypothetical protein
LGRGTEAERHKTSVPCTSQNVEKFNFTRSWRLTLDIRVITGVTVLKSGSCRICKCSYVLRWLISGVFAFNTTSRLFWGFISFMFIFVSLNHYNAIRVLVNINACILLCTCFWFLGSQYKAIDLIWIRAQKAQETLLHMLCLHDANFLPSSAMKQNKGANITCNWRCRSFRMLCYGNW